MDIKELKETLKKALSAGLPVLIKGAPGVSKTDAVTQINTYETMIMRNGKSENYEICLIMQ